MELIKHSTHQILTTIIRHTYGHLTIAIIGETLKMSHVGVWKALKKLEAENMVILKSTGNKKNSVYTVHLNWDNSLIKKTLILALEHEAASQKRWAINFAELEDKVDFLILYGSVLVSLQKANDIDLLSIVSKKNVSIEIERIIIKAQKTQLKQIHNIIFAPAGLKYEINKSNIAFINAIKNGVVLFGQDKFVKFMQELKQ